MSTSESPATDSPPLAATMVDPPRKPKKARDQRIKRWIVAGSAVVVGLALLAAIQFQGHISGTEFSSTHFQLRRFQFYEIPLLHLQLTPIRRTAATPPMANYLRQKSMIQAPAGQPDRWDLVSFSRGLTGTTYADANLLIDQMHLDLEGDLYWQQWSDDHPRRAAILWPLIQKLAERELYILMPSMFEIAQRDQSPEQLQEQLNEYLLVQYRSLIADMTAANRTALAAQLAAEARADFPDIESWPAVPTESTP